MATSKIMLYIDNIILYIANSEEYIKTIKTNRRFLQWCKIQDKYVKINYISVFGK